MKDTYWIQLHQQYRDVIKHEDNLINIRIGWMTAIQAVLLAAFFSDNFGSVPRELVAFFGVIIASVSLSGVYVAQMAINGCVDKWLDLQARHPDEPLGELPGIIGFSPSRSITNAKSGTNSAVQRKILRWLTPALALTFIVFAMWVLLLVELVFVGCLSGAETCEPVLSSAAGGDQ